MATNGTATDGLATDGTDTDGTAAAANVDGNMSTDGTISHAIVDIGGFLGMGAHSVALPISDLAIYSNGNETRVYLPWTREQLEAQPAYDEKNQTLWAA